jgi:hypothetical protein
LLHTSENKSAGSDIPTLNADAFFWILHPIQPCLPNIPETRVKERRAMKIVDDFDVDPSKY